jgi:hypothetical protein
MQLNESDVVNLFYRFDPAVWGCGLASETASAVTGWAAQNIPGRALIARIRPQNVASQRVAIHAGLARAEHLDSLGEDGVDWIFVPTSGLQFVESRKPASLCAARSGRDGAAPSAAVRWPGCTHLCRISGSGPARSDWFRLDLRG